MILTQREKEALLTNLSAEIMKLDLHYGEEGATERQRTLCSIRDKVLALNTEEPSPPTAMLVKELADICMKHHIDISIRPTLDMNLELEVRYYPETFGNCRVATKMLSRDEIDLVLVSDLFRTLINCLITDIGLVPVKPSS